jgi:drug/metabolite transporter (DMT)-like permease
MSVYSVLLIAVFAVSWSSIFIRWCGDTPALVISFYRMFWSTFLLLLYQLLKNPSELKVPLFDKKSRIFLIIAGVFLALHFSTWIASVQLTTISHSLILESTHPVFALVLSPFLLKERGHWKSILAAFITLGGIIIIAGQDLNVNSQRFLGDLLALAGALFVTLYLFVARQQRDKIKILPYLIWVYGSATVTLLILIIIMGYSLIMYDVKIHFMMLLLAIIPTGIGHSLINWGARRIPVYKVNFFILGEPIIASILAYLILFEKPYGLFYIGAVFVLSGIVLALLDKPEKSI